MPHFQSPLALQLLARKKMVYELLASQFTLTRIAASLNLNSVNGVYRAAISPEAEILDSVPEGWVGVYTAARLTGVPRDTINRAAMHGNIAMHLHGSTARRVVNLDDVQALKGKA